MSKWGTYCVNGNGEYLVDVCAERGLFSTNTFFQHKMTDRNTLRRGGMGEQVGFLDYIAVDKSLGKDVLVGGEKVVIGLFDVADLVWLS